MDRRTALSWMGFGAVTAGWHTARGTETPAAEWQGEVLEWPFRTPHPVTTALDVAPSRALFASGGDDHLIHVWQAEPARVLGHLSGHGDWVRAILFVDDTRLISGSNDGTIRLWHRPDTPSRADATVVRRAAAPWTALVSSSDRQRWAAVSFTGRVEWYDARRTARLGQVDLEARDLRCAAFSPDARELSVAGRDGRIYRIDLETTRVVASRHMKHRRRRALLYGSGGEIMTAGDDGILCRLAPAGEKTCRDQHVSRARIDCMLPWDDTHVVVGGSDNVVRVVDTERQQVVAELRGHTGTVAALGQLDSKLLSAGYDTTIRLWTPHTAVARRPAGRWRAR